MIIHIKPEDIDERFYNDIPLYITVNKGDPACYIMTRQSKGIRRSLRDGYEEFNFKSAEIAYRYLQLFDIALSGKDEKDCPEFFI